MDLEEAEEEAAVVEAEVLAEAEDGAGLALEGLVEGLAALPELAFALIAERLCLTDAGFLVFRQNALIAVHP